MTWGWGGFFPFGFAQGQNDVRLGGVFPFGFAQGQNDVRLWRGQSLYDVLLWRVQTP